jgi:hypothetical protein
MGNNSSYTHIGTGGRLQTADTHASGKNFFTNCFCFGCGCADELMRPSLAGELRCCCLEHGTRVDLSHCDKASKLCMGRAGCKVGPVVGEAKNPLIDNHEFVVVMEKKLLDFGHATKVDGRTQTSDTRISGKNCHTNCGCLGCGLTDDLCKPALAGEFRCCCLESGTRIDFSNTETTSDLCRCRAGCKVCPVVVDAKNPLVDNHELIVVCENKIYGCK